MTTNRYIQINEYWFGTLTSPDTLPEQAMGKWFLADESADKYVATNFKDDLERAQRGEYAAWKQSPEGILALILLYDQFSRNMFRGTQDAYKFDDLAGSLCIKSIRDKSDLKLFPIQRTFIYMPLMHCENLTMQIESIKQYTSLYEGAPQTLKPYFKKTLDFAKQHMTIIEKFGRFPHRNKVLGRNTSLKESEFLKQPNSRF